MGNSYGGCCGHGRNPMARQAIFGGSSYDSDAQTFFNELSTQPSDTNKAYYNVFIQSLKAGSNNFSKLDRFWWFGSEFQDNARVSLVNPTSTDITEVNVPIWTQYVGYTGNGIDMYLDTNYNPLTSGVNYIQNSASIGIYSRTNSDGFLVDIGCNNGATKYIQIDTKEGGISYSDVNDFLGDSVVVSDSLALFTCVRTGAVATESYKRGTSIDTGNSASTGVPSQNIYILCRNNNGVSGNFSSRQLLCAFVGGGTVNVSELYTSIQNFATSIGSQV